MNDIYQRTGIKIPFPIIADLNGTIARRYGMISNEINPNQTVRNVFIIDDKGIVRAIFVYPMNVGRCIPEILRTVEALQTADRTGGSTPANWVNGNPIIQSSPQTNEELQARVNEIEQERNGFSWYLSFKEAEDYKATENREIKKSTEGKS